MTGSHSHGQGHETAFAQVVAEMLGSDEGAVDIVHGDTSKIPFGMGTYGSRSLAVGGTAIVNASRRSSKRRRSIAAHLLEASEADIDLRGRRVHRGRHRQGKAFAESRWRPTCPTTYPIEEIEPGLEETAFYDPKNFTFPGGAYACEVEVDPDTGKVQVLSFRAPTISATSSTR
jgi:carbon-monoxide dehydrogenase large subunit